MIYETSMNDRTALVCFIPSKIEVLKIRKGIICVLHEAAGTAHVMYGWMNMNDVESFMASNIGRGTNLTSLGLSKYSEERIGIGFKGAESISEDAIAWMEERLANRA